MSVAKQSRISQTPKIKKVRSSKMNNKQVSPAVINIDIKSDDKSSTSSHSPKDNGNFQYQLKITVDTRGVEKRVLDDEDDPAQNYIKKRKIDVDENEKISKGINVNDNSNKSISEKVETEEEIEARWERQKRYIKSFANISLKYSQFLEKKVSTLHSSGSSLQPVKEENQDTIKQLKYFTGDLRPYQLEGVTWLSVLFKNSINGILADEMGLGKTIQVIAFFCYLYERKISGPFLIVAPLSTLSNWESEFRRFAPKLPVIRLQGSPEERQKQMSKIKKASVLDERHVKPVVLVSYQIPLMEHHFLDKFKWQYIVIDEGHRIKNPNCRLFQELTHLRSVNRLILTGTPLQNDIKELWALFNFLMPELFNDIEGFSSILELDDIRDTDKLLLNEARTKVISTIHKVLAPFMLRREKKFVLTDLVPKKEMIIYCPLTEMQNYLYKACLQKDMVKLTMEGPSDKAAKKKRTRNSRETIDYTLTNNKYKYALVSEYDQKMNSESFDNSDKNLFSTVNVPIKCPDAFYMIRLTMTNLMMMLRKAVNHPYLIWTPIDPNAKSRQLLIDEDLIKQSGKLLVLDALLPRLKKKGNKVLIFSTFTMFIDMIEEMLIMRDYEYRRLDGVTNFQARTDAINDFQNDPDVFVFLLSTRAGGLGLNLTAADTVIFMDRDWNPMVDIQAQDRCHRIGQTKPVMIYSLITKGTIDEIILSRGDIKKRLEKIVLQEGKFKTIKKNFDEDELQALEDLLNNEEKMVKIHSNGLFYSEEELDDILNRDDLLLNDSTCKT